MKFFVDTVEEVKTNSYIVKGVCYQNSNKEDLIRLGDCFLKAYKHILKPTKEGGFEIVGEEDIRDIKLQVKEIKTYGRNTEEIYSGMSGELYLIGEGGTKLTKKDILEGVNLEDSSSIN